jgi:fatty acyl-CoA reductase
MKRKEETLKVTHTLYHCRYDVALDSNTLGPFRIISFAQRCRRLKLFMHVSTGY